MWILYCWNVFQECVLSSESVYEALLIFNFFPFSACKHTRWVSLPARSRSLARCLASVWGWGRWCILTGLGGPPWCPISVCSKSVLESWQVEGKTRLLGRSAFHGAGRSSLCFFQLRLCFLWADFETQEGRLGVFVLNWATVMWERKQATNCCRISWFLFIYTRTPLSHVCERLCCQAFPVIKSCDKWSSAFYQLGCLSPLIS